jgi:hypothetical protein
MGFSAKFITVLDNLLRMECMSESEKEEFVPFIDWETRKSSLFDESNKEIKNEWEYFDFYNNKNKEYLKENYYYYLSDLKLKFQFIFFNVYNENSLTNAYGNNFNTHKIHVISNIINRLIFITAIYTFIYNIKKKKFILKKIKQELYFFFFVTAIILPSLIAWPTTKHLTPVFLISIIYLFSSNYKLTKKLY